jgi:hypothetical protein
MVMFRKISGRTSGFGIGFLGNREVLTVEGWRANDSEGHTGMLVNFSRSAPLHFGVALLGKFALNIQLFAVVELDD